MLILHLKANFHSNFIVMKQNRISETERMMNQQTGDFKLTPDYIDDDLIVIDNVKLLGLPDTNFTNMNLLAYCKTGKCQISVNGEMLEVHENQVFICPPEMSLDDIMVSPDFEYQALCITNRMLQMALKEYIKVWNQLTYVSKLRVIGIEKGDFIFYEKTYDLLKLCLEWKSEDRMEEIYRGEMLRGIISSVLIGFCSILQKHTDSTLTAPRQNVSLFNQFLELLQTTEAKHNTVEYYAAQLCISSKYLTIISKKNSGRTANEWIQEYTLSAITNDLRTTTLSVKEISNKLGFPNTSFFGKYVKEHTGCSPLEYRKKLNTPTL